MQKTLKTAEIAVLVGYSPRHTARLLRATGVQDAPRGHWPLGAIIRLAIEGAPRFANSEAPSVALSEDALTAMRQQLDA